MDDSEKAPRNDGKTVERLVKLIEGTKLPEGFTVETRHSVFDDDGNYIAELDILITGKVGTDTYLSLIECRDRPSDGPAPRSWIEQLIGRRQSLNIPNVMAVSSTGFAQGAKKLAEQTGIKLRQLQNLTHEDVAHWLPITAPLVIHHGEFNSVRLGVKTQIEAKAGSQVRLKPGDLVFRHVHSGEMASLMDLWRQIINEDSSWRGVPKDGTPTPVKIVVGTQGLQEYAFAAAEGDLEIEILEFDAILTAGPSSMRFIQAASYLSQPVEVAEQEKFVELGRWVGSENDLIREMIVLGYPKKPAKLT